MNLTKTRKERPMKTSRHEDTRVGALLFFARRASSFSLAQNKGGAKYYLNAAGTHRNAFC